MNNKNKEPKFNWKEEIELKMDFKNGYISYLLWNDYDGSYSVHTTYLGDFLDIIRDGDEFNEHDLIKMVVDDYKDL